MKQIEMETELTVLDAELSREKTIIENKIRDRRISIVAISTQNKSEIASLKSDIYKLEKELATIRDHYAQRRATLLKEYGDETGQCV